jgi:hypothetical protein
MGSNDQEGEGLALGVAHCRAQKHEILWILWIPKLKKWDTKTILSQRIGLSKAVIGQINFAIFVSALNWSESLLVCAAQFTIENAYGFPDRCGIVGDPKRDNCTCGACGIEIFVIELQLDTLPTRRNSNAPTVVGSGTAIISTHWTVSTAHGFKLLCLNCGKKAKNCAEK